MLTPTKRNKVDEDEPERAATPLPTHRELFRWVLTKDAVAPCHIKDVHSLQERTTPGSADPLQASKHLEFPPPLATVGECVSIIGRASKTKSNEWQIQITGIELCTSRNEELLHHLKVLKLHKTNYSLTAPFYPPDTTQDGPAIPVTPTQKRAPRDPASKASNFTAQSSPVTVIASSPIKSEQVQATPTKLRHPSRLHHVELTRNTFRIYLKYFMDTGLPNEIDDNDDPFASSFASELLNATNNNANPRPTQFSTTRSRPNIDPIFYGTSTASSSKAREGANPTEKMHGYTVSYLRRVPELVLLANRVVKQELRLARKQEKERKAAGSSSSKPTPAISSRARNPSSKDIKRLFLRAVNDLYREGSIVIWDCPAYPCKDAASADTSFLWKPMTNASGMLSLSYAGSSANTTAASSIFGHSSSKPTSGDVPPPTVPEDEEGDLSDPDPHEDVYVSVKPAFLADRLEEIIPVVQNAERRGQRESQAKRGLYRGASSQGLLRHLKGDDRWTFVHMDSVDAALKHLEEDGRAWVNPSGQWQLTV
ncbi:hypothetical protein MD484_g560, partial [Candolleomyces efflorescens]